MSVSLNAKEFELILTMLTVYYSFNRDFSHFVYNRILALITICNEMFKFIVHPCYM